MLAILGDREQRVLEGIAPVGRIDRAAIHEEPNEAAVAFAYGEMEWGLEAEPGEEIQAWLEGRLRERIGVDAPVTHRWAGVISYTDDKLPIFEEARPGVFAVGGFSGHGNVLGSAAGRAAMAIALESPPPPLARWLG